jgi:predicted DNA binding protein
MAMWVAEFKVWHEDSVALELVKRFGVRVTAYYLNTWQRKKSAGGGLGVTKVLLVKGARRREFIDEFIKRIGFDVKFVCGDELFYAIDDPSDSYHSLLFDSSVFMTRPILIEGGFEYWSVASWDKTKLKALVVKSKRMRKKSFVKLLSLKERDVDLLLPTAFDRLSPRQASVFLAAVAAGYYSFPRRVSAEQLAARLKRAPSVVREHLRRAEAKIMAGVASQIAGFSE